jgi:hypothetical protein
MKRAYSQELQSLLAEHIHLPLQNPFLTLQIKPPPVADGISIQQCSANAASYPAVAVGARAPPIDLGTILTVDSARPN